MLIPRWLWVCKGTATIQIEHHRKSQQTAVTVQRALCTSEEQEAYMWTGPLLAPPRTATNEILKPKL